MSYLLYGLLAIGVLVAFAFTITWLRLRLFHRRASAVIATTYASLQHPPDLRVKYSYGFPAFSLTFRNHLVLEQATRAGLNDAFLREMDALFAGCGQKGRPFRAEAAVAFSHRNFLTREDIGLP